LPGRIGDVLVARPVGGAPRHFVVLAGGLQGVPEVLAELLRVAAGQARDLPLGTDELAGATLVGDLPVDGWPPGAPRLREPADAPVLCWTWTAATAPDGAPSGAVWVGAAEPQPARSVTLAQADGPGTRVDAVAVGSGGAVRATGPGRSPTAGPLWLVSATGVTFGVADDATAAALGITTAEPAPEAVLRLLPTGPALDLADAGRVWTCCRRGEPQGQRVRRGRLRSSTTAIAAAASSSPAVARSRGALAGAATGRGAVPGSGATAAPAGGSVAGRSTAGTAPR
jgi:hypothetical protein